MKYKRILCLLAAFLLLAACGAAPAAPEDVAEGLAYLEQLETGDPGEVSRILRQRRLDEIQAQRDELLRQLQSGEKDVWSMFEDYVVLGDSRAVGFYYYDFLEKRRVLAAGGDTIRNIEGHIDEIKALNPRVIFLCYGLNDVGIGFWKEPEDYAAEFMEIVERLNAEVPDALVVISSILPGTEIAFQKGPAWRRIPEFSAAVEAACKERGIAFANNDALAAERADLYGPDGVHLQTPFYPLWAANLIMAELEAESSEPDDT